MGIQDAIENNIRDNKKIETKQWIQDLLQEGQLVGDLYSINYETAKVIVHDTFRHNVGGIPSLSFLIASRLDPKNCDDIDYKDEDTSFILLRVMDSTTLPQDVEAEKIRVETAQRVSGDSSKNVIFCGKIRKKLRAEARKRESPLRADYMRSISSFETAAYSSAPFP